MWIDDQVLACCDQPLCLKVFFPRQDIVVCGRSNKIETEVHLEACQNAGVDVVKRRGGGGTVLLGEDTCVVSIGLWVSDYFQNKRYFDWINGTMIQALTALDPVFSKMTLKGISDVAFENKKIIGTSLFRSRNYLLFQGSILFQAPFAKIDRYLKHPTSEPDYRRTRKHRDFLSDVRTVSPEVEKSDFLRVTHQEIEKILEEDTNNYRIDPVEMQIAHVRTRLSQTHLSKAHLSKAHLSKT